MNTLELHLIQNFPVSCLVRDENGSPKNAIFGGTLRARMSSQSYKRAVRELMAEQDKTFFGGIRTKSLGINLCNALQKKGMEPELAEKLSNSVAGFLGKSENEQTKTVLYFSEGEIEIIAKEIYEKSKADKLKDIFDITTSEDTKSYECKAGKILKTSPIDIADIEVFGRMVASDPNLFIEGASSFAHPFSVHACENELDFFAAVDEQATEQGAGFIGEVEFNSACYYNCVSLNLDIFHGGRLSQLSEEDRKRILKIFIESCIIAVPKARHNSMFAATKPFAVFGLVRENTFPLSLANAFETALSPSKEGFSIKARKRLEEEWENVSKAYGKRLGVKKSAWFPDLDLDNFIKELV